MDFKKIALIKHHQSIVRMVEKNKNIIFFLTRENLDSGKDLELYDINASKIIKIVDNVIDDPIINKKFLSMFAWKQRDQLNGKYVDTLYNLKTNAEKKTNGCYNFHSGMSKLNFLFDEEKLLTLEGKEYILYDIESRETIKLGYQGDRNCIISPDEKHLIFEGEYGRTSHYDIKNQKFTLFGNDIKINNEAYYEFNENSTLFAYFDLQKQLIRLYDLKNGGLLKKSVRMDCSPDGLTFLDDETLLIKFQNGSYIKYNIWNIKEHTINFLISCDRPMSAVRVNHYLKRNKQLLINYPETVWRDFGDCQALYYEQTIYDIKEKKLITLPASELYFNMHGTYAMQTTKNNTVTIYETNNWNIYKIINIPTETVLTWCLNWFAPCGKMVLIIWKENLQLYDIEEDRVTLTSIHNHYEYPKFYKYNLIIFASDERTLVVYDYIVDKKIELKTKETITYFSIEGDLLLLSSGKQTELYDLSDVTAIREKLYSFNDFDCNFIYKQ